MTESSKLLNFEFIGLCLIASLGFCNVTVFYDLYTYLQTLGIREDLCGLLIGAYSLTAMLLFLLVSPFLNAANAPRIMLLGMAILVASGFSYLWVHSFWGLLGVRIVNGLGQFLLGAGVMSLFVSVIPPAKNGQAFGLYSVAILIPYGVVPTVMEVLSAYLPTSAHGYALATVSYLPAAWIVLKIRRRDKVPMPVGGRHALPAWKEIRANLTQLPVALLLLLNLSYFVIWSSLFFLFKGFALEQGIANVGSFFMVQTGVMILLRLMAGRLFDFLDKSWLVLFAFTLVTAAFLALDNLPGAWAVPLVALLFGLGMGGGYPSINGLMFEVSTPAFRVLNANLMLFTVQGGFFFGPSLGGALVARLGYHGYFLGAIGLALTGAVLGGLLAIIRRNRMIEEEMGV